MLNTVASANDENSMQIYEFILVLSITNVSSCSAGYKFKLHSRQNCFLEALIKRPLENHANIYGTLNIFCRLFTLYEYLFTDKWHAARKKIKRFTI